MDLLQSHLIGTVRPLPLLLFPMADGTLIVQVPALTAAGDQGCVVVSGTGQNMSTVPACSLVVTTAPQNHIHAQAKEHFCADLPPLSDQTWGP